MERGSVWSVEREMKSEIRAPKSERNPKSEIRSPKEAATKPLPPAQPKLNLKRGTASEYCPGCGMLRSQCDCWDPVNQPQ